MWQRHPYIWSTFFGSTERPCTHGCACCRLIRLREFYSIRYTNTPMKPKSKGSHTCQMYKKTSAGFGSSADLTKGKTAVCSRTHASYTDCAISPYNSFPSCFTLTVRQCTGRNDHLCSDQGSDTVHYLVLFIKLFIDGNLPQAHFFGKQPDGRRPARRTACSSPTLLQPLGNTATHLRDHICLPAW